ncbi:hypothetical protein CPB83DRAFT_852780 [Crepidotus variabilis]|uniref:Uncharacterized protein n=1 Tax=Crepidotus variabilis TaxID=179855 RepID=A0A9P6JQR7_9AGAR|nr:hypothetical protein CPB83DRAFT_852780 [Crepidotus variabilis]
MIFPSDGTINDSEWVSMSLDLRLDSDDGHITQNPASNSSSSAKPSPNSPPTSRHPKYHFEDLWVALLATHDSSYHFAMDMQSWWFCYISMIVFGMSVEREGEVREYGLDDGRGEVRVCGDWVKIKRRQREMKRESESDQSRSHSKEKMYIYKPVWRQVRIEKVVQPTLRLAMEDVRQERAFDKNWQHSWIWEGSRTLWSAGA